MSLTVWLPWSIHLTGSDWILVRPSTSTPPTNRIVARTTIGSPKLVGSPPSLTTSFSTADSLRSSVRFVHSRIPSAEAGITMPTVTNTITPTARSTPKSRIIGTFEICNAMNASTPVIVATISGGTTFASDSAIGCTSLSSTTSSSTRL